MITTAILAFLLSGSPKIRIVIGLPLYAIDLVVLFLAFKDLGKRKIVWNGYSRQIVQLLIAYLCFTMIGELHGAFVYGRAFESLYLMFRTCLAVSVAFLVPKSIYTLDSLKLVLKGIAVGLVFSASLSILYSIPFTRALTEPLFALKILAPDTDQIVGVANSYYESVYSGAYRGRTLIGAPTISAGVLATLGPMALMGTQLFQPRSRWNKICKIALILFPIGVLATYGRFAWISLVLMALAFVWCGSTKGKIRLLSTLLCVTILAAQLGTATLTENFPLINRIVSKTQKTAVSSSHSESESERFLAYTEPFSHVFSYPSFFLLGSGVAQRRWGGNAFQEAETASHAVPAMAYYAYGMGGAFCQVALLLLLLRMISRRLQQAKLRLAKLAWMWRSLLICWFGLLPWWCFAHGIVTAPRGAMVFFLYIGIVLACDRIFTRLCRQQANMSISPTATL